MFNNIKHLRQKAKSFRYKVKVLIILPPSDWLAPLFTINLAGFLCFLVHTQNQTEALRCPGQANNLACPKPDIAKTVVQNLLRQAVEQLVFC